MDSRLTKPKVNDKGQPLNPEELPALRIYQRYGRFRRLGKSDVEAADLALREIGTCHRILASGEKCGEVAITERSFICADHKAQDTRDRAKKAREDKKHHVPGVCQVCGAKFIGHRGRKNCDAHTQVRLEPRSDAGKPHANRIQPTASPAMRTHTASFAKPDSPTLPDTWEKPIPEHLRELPKPAPVVVPPGFVVKVIPQGVSGREKERY